MKRFLVGTVLLLLLLTLVTVQTTYAQLSNVVLNKPVTADSVEVPRFPEKAVDGQQFDGRWTSADKPFPHWIQVELGNSYELSQLKFWTGMGNSLGFPVSDYQLQYWDGWQWVDLLSVENDDNGGSVDKTFPATLSSERIRLYATSGPDNFFRLLEMEVYGELHDLHVQGRQPASGAEVVQVGEPITVSFNREISLADADLLRVRDPESHQPVEPFSATVSGDQLVLTPDTAWPWGQTVEVVIPAGALTAATDATLENGTLLWEFTTVPERPQLVEAPYDTADLAADITVTFDRPLQLLQASAVRLFDVTAGQPVSSSATVAGNELVIGHSGLETEHIYRVLVDAGAIEGQYGGLPNARLMQGLYGGLITLLDTTFDTGMDGWTVTGRWEWEGDYRFADYGYMLNGSSEADKHARSPAMNLSADEEYQINLYTGTSTNKVMVGLATAPFNLDMSDPAYQNSSDWLEIGRWSYDWIRKASFSPPADGDYHVVVTSAEVGNPYHASAFDNVLVNKAVPPQIVVDSPAAGSEFAEGTTVPLAFDVLELAGEVTDVTVYDPVDERQIASFTGLDPDGYTVDWNYITTPGTRNLQITARDSTGLERTLEWPVTITLDDGSLPSLVHWDFDSGDEGWTGEIEVKWNDRGPGSNGLETGGQPPWLASPKVFLFAGETYRLDFDYKSLKDNSGYIYGFLPYASAELPVDETPVQEFLLQNTEWDSEGVEFTVPEDGPYHLVFWETARNTTQSEVMFDNIRLEGVFNSGPAIELTSPAAGIRSVVGGTVTLSAEASDLDGEVTEVRFMRRSRILATDTTPPYEYEWTLPTTGELAVHAVAYDNNNGFTATDEVVVEVEENRLDLSTYLGNSSDVESVRQVAYQSDGTLVMAGILDPEVLTGKFPSVPVQYLNGTGAGDRGVLARFTETGDQMLSLAVVGESALDLSLDDADHIHVAAGSDGAVKLNPAGDTMLWSHVLENKRAHRIDSGPNGTVVVLYSGQPDNDSKQLWEAQTALLESDGTQSNLLGSAGTFTTDVCVHEPSQTVVQVGFKNFNTDSNPVDVPVMYGRAYDNSLKYRAYDWGQNPGMAPDPDAFTDESGSFAEAYSGWDPLYDSTAPVIDVQNAEPPTVADLQAFGTDAELNAYTNASGTGYLEAYIQWRGVWDRWLNRPENNMADSRGARVIIGEDGYLYAGFEYDGGNTPLRFNPYSLDEEAPIVEGDQYHFMAFTSTVPKVFVGRYEAPTGEYVLGQWTTARLSSGGDNTLRLDEGDLYADRLGRVHIVGSAAASIDTSIDHFPGGYGGGSYYLVLSPDFANRELWVRFNTGGFGRGVAMSPNGRIAMGGDTNSPHFLTNAWQENLASEEDAFLVVGDFIPYFSFQTGDHPRLFFGEDKVADLRAKLDEEPFQSMYQSLLFQLQIGSFADWYNPNEVYDVSLKAFIHGFLYLLTEDESHAQEARSLVETVLANTQQPWADGKTKGLALYWMSTRVAITYDWCVSSEAWDESFSYTVSSELLKAAEVILNDGGSQQNPATGSNWQGARGASGGLALLATDHVYGNELADAAWGRVERYIQDAFGGSGWLSEGTGYFYFPVANYVGPYGIALARQNPDRDLRDFPAFRNGYWAAVASNVAHTRPEGWPAVQTDWSDDNPHTGGEGVYGQAFYYLPEELQRPYKHAYDVTQGTQSPFYQEGVYDDGLWDAYRGGTLWSYLYYPSEQTGMPPEESYAWHERMKDPDGIGLYTFRDQFADGSDRLTQFKARLDMVEGGHDGPDGLGFRIIANGAPFVLGGGRNAPGKNTGQPVVYPQDPELTVSTNDELGELVGTPLVTHRGDGHIIARMDTNNVQTANHKRWLVTRYDEATTGADAAYVVADTTDNGQFWNLSTYVKNTVTTSGNTFTVTAENGASMRGTVLYPKSGYIISTGTRSRGSIYGYDGGGFRRDGNPPIEENRYVQVESSAADDFLVALTVVKSGESHPAVSHDSGSVADAVVSIGGLQMSLQPDDVLYNGSAYQYPNAVVSFSAGQHGTLGSGSAQQSVPYGQAAVAPDVTAESGYLFSGWDKDFDPVLKDMTVTALYDAVETVPTAPDQLEAVALSSTEIAVNWQDNSTGESGFVLESSADGNSWTELASLAAEQEQYNHEGLAPQSTVYYRVKATGSGGDSDWSALASATTFAPNDPPSFAGTPGLVAHETLPYFETLQATDPEGDALVIEMVSMPAWLELNDFGDGTADLVGTPPLGAAGEHAVTVEVSDGNHDPVSRTFTITVNAQPVVSLVSPTMNPVALPTGVGLLLEVSVADETATGVSWSLVDGPGAVAFDQPNGLSNGVVPTADGTYILRATADDGTLQGSLDVEVEWGAAAVRPESQTVVDYGYTDLDLGKYGSADFRGTGLSTATGLDLDGDGNADDEALYYAFREDAVFTNTTYPSPNDRNFYGGLVLRSVDGNAGLGSAGLNDATPVDKINIRSSSNTNSLTSVWFWDKADFRNGADGATVSLGSGAALSVPGLFGRLDGGRLHWLVRNGDQYYVSESTLGNNALAAELDSTEMETEQWASYNPTPGTYEMDFHATTAVFDTPSSELDNITALGLIWDMDSFAAARRWLSFGTFRAVALVQTPVNRGPLVNAGDDPAVEPGVSVSLSGSVADEGKPETPGNVSVQWSVQAGPDTNGIGAPGTVDTSFTPAAEGQYVLRLTADDGSIRTFDEVVVTSTLADPFTAWMEGYPSLSAEEMAPDSDPSGDGIPNLLKFAFGLDPTQRHAQSGFAGREPAAAGERLGLEIDLAAQQDSVRYLVEAADDLAGPWTVLAEAVGGASLQAAPGLSPTPEVIAHGGGQFTVRDHETADSSDSGRRFLRLRVVYEEAP